MLNKVMFSINVRYFSCSLIYDPQLERPFHKDFNGVCFFFGGCILAKVIVKIIPIKNCASVRMTRKSFNYYAIMAFRAI